MMYSMVDADQNMSHAPRERYVLVADDDAGTRRLFEGLIVGLGAKVTLTTSGEEALATMSPGSSVHSPDMIFLDMRMPNLDGIKTAHAFREQGYKGPIFIFTSGATLEKKKESEVAGVTRFFSKTVLKKDLLRALLEEYAK